MRIIKKYEEFLREAVYAPPPPPPPAIYSTVDMKKADDSGNYMFQTGDTWSKGDNKASENQKIDPSEWGIPDANLPETVEGWHSVNDPFIKAYSNYLNDSTGTQKGYVGKTLLIFQKKDGKELGSFVQNGKILGAQNEMTYYYVTKDAVKYKVESSFKDGKGTITIFAGEKATRSFDLASGQMLVKKSAHDDLINGDLINTPIESKDNGGQIVSYLPSAGVDYGKVNIVLNTNGSQLSVTDGVPSSIKITLPIVGVSTDSKAPVLIQKNSSKDNQRVFYINSMGEVGTGSQKGFEVLPEVFSKHGASVKLGVPGVKENQIVPNIEGFGTVYAYKYIYKGTTKGNIIYRSNTPSEVEDSFGNTAKGNVEDGYYSVPLNTSRYPSGAHSAATKDLKYLEYNVDDVNVHQPFKTDTGKKVLSSIAGKNGKQIEVKWDAKAKKFVSDYKVIKATLTDSQRSQMIN